MLSSRTPGSDRVAFVYVPGGSTLGAFAAFLRDYGALFRRLGQSPIRFCTTNADVARKARGLCYRRYRTTGLAMHPALTRPGDPVVRRGAVLHFEARRRFAARAFHTFSRGDLDRPRPTCHPCWSRPGLRVAGHPGPSLTTTEQRVTRRVAPVATRGPECVRSLAKANQPYHIWAQREAFLDTLLA